jgi:hypothetical protein
VKKAVKCEKVVPFSEAGSSEFGRNQEGLNSVPSFVTKKEESELM